MSIGIRGIGTALGAESIDNLAQGAGFGRSAEFITEKIGFSRLRRLGPGQSLLDLCLDAFRDLKTRQAIEPESIECLVLVTQNPLGQGLPHNSARLQALLGLSPQCACFDISLGCSGYVYALSIVSGFMKKLGLKRGLLFTADPYSLILDSSDPNTALLFGDGASVSLMDAEPVYLEGRPILATCGEEAQALSIAPQSGKLKMDGQRIFNFVLRHAPAQIRACLAQNGLEPKDVQYFLFHQASRYIVENLARRLQIPLEKVLFNQQDIGNTVSSSLPFALGEIWDAQPSPLLLCGFGVGLSLGTTVLFAKQG